MYLTKATHFVWSQKCLFYFSRTWLNVCKFNRSQYLCQVNWSTHTLSNNNKASAQWLTWSNNYSMAWGKKVNLKLKNCDKILSWCAMYNVHSRIWFFFLSQLVHLILLLSYYQQCVAFATDDSDVCDMNIRINYNSIVVVFILYVFKLHFNLKFIIHETILYSELVLPILILKYACKWKWKISKQNFRIRNDPGKW